MTDNKAYCVKPLSSEGISEPKKLTNALTYVRWQAIYFDHIGDQNESGSHTVFYLSGL